MSPTARSWIAPALAVACLSWAGTAWAQATPPAKGEADAVAVLPLELVGNVPAGRPALEAAVVRGLTMFTGTTVEATQASARLIAAGAKLPCEDAACWTAAGKAIGAKHLVAGRVERKGANFEVQFRLLEGASGRLLATETNKCEAADCSVAELTRQTVRELARTMLSGPPTGDTAVAPVAVPPGAAPEASGAAASAGVESPPVSLVESGPAPDAGESWSRRMLPYGVMVLGVGTMAAGGYLMKLDADCKEWALRAVPRECNTYHETMWAGVSVTGVGAALLATGVVVAITDHQDRKRATVSVGPSSVLLSGRF